MLRPAALSGSVSIPLKEQFEKKLAAVTEKTTDFSDIQYSIPTGSNPILHGDQDRLSFYLNGMLINEVYKHYVQDQPGLPRALDTDRFRVPENLFYDLVKDALFPASRDQEMVIGVDANIDYTGALLTDEQRNQALAALKSNYSQQLTNFTALFGSPSLKASGEYSVSNPKKAINLTSSRSTLYCETFQTISQLTVMRLDEAGNTEPKNIKLDTPITCHAVFKSKNNGEFVLEKVHMNEAGVAALALRSCANQLFEKRADIRLNGLTVAQAYNAYYQKKISQGDLSIATEEGSNICPAHFQNMMLSFLSRHQFSHKSGLAEMLSSATGGTLINIQSTNKGGKISCVQAQPGVTDYLQAIIYTLFFGMPFKVQAKEPLSWKTPTAIRHFETLRSPAQNAVDPSAADSANQPEWEHGTGGGLGLNFRYQPETTRPAAFAGQGQERHDPEERRDGPSFS